MNDTTPTGDRASREKASIVAEVSDELRHDIAAARERAELDDSLRGSVLWERLKVGGYDDIRREIDSLPWPAPGKQYTPGGLEPIYKDRDGVMRVRYWDEP